MLKDLLLQFFLSVFPAVATVFWRDKDRGRRGHILAFAASAGLSIVVCSLMPVPIFGHSANLALVPYLIGSLYGGSNVFFALTPLYAAFRLPDISEGAGAFGIALAVLLFVAALMFILRRPFDAAAPARRQIIGLSIVLSAVACYALIVGAPYVASGQAEGPEWLIGAVALAALIVSTSLSIYVVEGIKEKQLLYDKVERLSDSYRNEVEKVQQFIDRAPLAVLIVDRQGVITHANQEVVRLLGLRPGYATAASLKDAPCGDIFPEQPSFDCGGLLEQALQGRTSSMVPQITEQKMLLYTSVCLRDVTDNHISGAALIAQDVTELSQLRDEVGHMERLSLVGQMAASITHEIRNPLAVIRGFVQLLQERNSQSQYQYFRIIMDEIDRTNTIINDFLSLAQNRELKMEMASLNDVITDLMPLLDADAHMRGQALQVELCSDLPMILLNDREMKQLLLNLARNGMEAMNDKGVLAIRTTYSNEEISLLISDQGVGIPQENLKNLFEPFFTTKTRGTGLGLPLCLSIAERHGGKIDVCSKAGAGTTFRVSFNISGMRQEHTIA